MKLSIILKNGRPRAVVKPESTEDAEKLRQFWATYNGLSAEAVSTIPEDAFLSMAIRPGESKMEIPETKPALPA